MNDWSLSQRDFHHFTNRWPQIRCFLMLGKKAPASTLPLAEPFWQRPLDAAWLQENGNPFRHIKDPLCKASIRWSRLSQGIFELSWIPTKFGLNCSSFKSGIKNLWNYITRLSMDGTKSRSSKSSTILFLENAEFSTIGGTSSSQTLPWKRIKLRYCPWTFRGFLGGCGVHPHFGADGCLIRRSWDPWSLDLDAFCRDSTRHEWKVTPSRGIQWWSWGTKWWYMMVEPFVS